MSDPMINSAFYRRDERAGVRRLLGFRWFRKDPVVVPDQNAASQSSAFRLDALAKVNEEVRDRCINIVNKSEELISLRNEFIEVFGAVGKILKDTEGTSSSLVERSAMLALEEQEHAALKGRYRALYEDNETNHNEASLLRGEIERAGDLLAGREVRIEVLEKDLSATKDSVATLQAELEQERDQVDLAARKLQTAQMEIQDNDALIQTLHAQLAALNDRCSAAEFHVKALQGSAIDNQTLIRSLRDSLAESQHKGEGLAQKLSDAESALQGFRTRCATLESALSNFRLEHEMAETLWRQHATANGDEIATLRAEVDAHRSRAEAGDQLLAEARADLQTKTADLRARERTVENLDASIAPLDGRIAEATREIARLNEKHTEAERSRAALADRAQALVRAMSDQKARLENSEQRAQLLEERLAAETSRFAEETEQLQLKAHDLAEQVEKEKVARAVVSSALEAARTRATRPNGASLLEILARADEADVEANNEDRRVSAARARAAEERPAAVLAATSATSAGKPRIGPVEANGPAKLTLPKSTPLVAKREKQSQGGGRI